MLGARGGGVGEGGFSCLYLYGFGASREECFSAPVIEEEFIFQISILGASFVALTFDSHHWHYGYLFKLSGFTFWLDIIYEIIAIIGQVLLKVCTFVNNPCSY